MNISKPWSKLIIRRVRKSEDEKEALKRLCNTDLALKRHLNNYQNWIEHTIRDFDDQHKLAFGAYLRTNNKEGTSIPSLVACAFIKRSVQTIEIKGIGLLNRGSDGRMTDDHKLWFTSLMKKIIHFCSTRDYRYLEIEVPLEMPDELPTLHELSFRVVSFRERHVPGKNYYLLQRKVGETYHAEPYDLLRLGKWICNNIFQSEVVEEKRNPPNVPSVYDLTFSPFPLNSALISKNANRAHLSNFIMNGQLLIMDADINSAVPYSTFKPLFKTTTRLKYLLTQGASSNFIKECAADGVHFITKEETITLAGGAESSLNLPIERNNIQGVITVLEQDRIEKYSKHGQFVYYLLSGRGKALLDREGVGAERLLAIYCPEWSLDGRPSNQGIVGLAKITRRIPKSYEGAGKLFKNIYHALEDDELSHYKTFSEDVRVYVLLCSQIQFLDTPLPLEKVSAKVNVLDYIKMELTDKWSSCVYFDAETAKHLKRHFKNNGKSIPRSQLNPPPVYIPKVLISHCKEDLEKVSQLVALLKQASFDVKIDEEQILPGTKTSKFMENFLKGACSADRVVICLSETYVSKSQMQTSSGVHTEWGMVLREVDKNEDTEIFIPVLLNSNFNSSKIPSVLKNPLQLRLWKKKEIKIKLKSLFESLKTKK